MTLKMKLHFFPKLLQFEDYFRIEKKNRKKMTYKTAINYFIVVTFNVAKLKNEFVNIYAKNAKILESNALIENLLPIFFDQKFKKNNLNISISMHREHLKAYVRILIILIEDICKKFFQ